MSDKKMTLEQVRDEMRGMHAPLTTGGALERWADAIDAELKSRREPVGSLHVFRDEDGTLFRPEFINPDVLPVGDHVLYLAPPAPKIEVTDAMVNKLTCWMIAQFGECAAPTHHKDRIAWWDKHARSALEAALKDTP